MCYDELLFLSLKSIYCDETVLLFFRFYVHCCTGFAAHLDEPIMTVTHVIMPSTSSRNPNPHQQNTTSHPLSHKNAPTETTQSSHTFFRSIAVPSSTDGVIRVPRCHPQAHTLRLVTTTSLCTGCNETMFFSSYTLSGLQQSAKTYDHPGLLFHIMVFPQIHLFCHHSQT